MSDITLLRTLTEKSLLKFGIFNDLTVREVVNSRGIKGIKILTFYYYQSDKISFVPELLDEFGIYEDIRIKKPGKLMKPEAQKLQNLAYINLGKRFEELKEDEQIMLKKRNQSYKKQNKNLEKRNCGLTSKINLDKQRAINQGNFRNKK